MSSTTTTMNFAYGDKNMCSFHVAGIRHCTSVLQKKNGIGIGNSVRDLCCSQCTPDPNALKGDVPVHAFAKTVVKHVRDIHRALAIGSTVGDTVEVVG